MIMDVEERFAKAAQRFLDGLKGMEAAAESRRTGA